MAKVTGKKLYWESDLFHLPSWIILQFQFKKWYSLLLIQFLTIRHNHPSIRFLLPTVTLTLSSHPIRPPNRCWILGFGSRYVCHGEGGITSVGSRRFGTSISGGLRFGSPDLWDVHVSVTRFFVATLAAKQTKKQWLKQKPIFLF